MCHAGEGSSIKKSPASKAAIGLGSAELDYVVEVRSVISPKLSCSRGAQLFDKGVSALIFFLLRNR